MSTTNRILHGDCRDMLRTLADCSVDSIVTDPPYELSQDGKASAARVAAKLMFPQQAHLVAESTQSDMLTFLLSKVAELRVVGVLPTEPAAMPVGAVALDDKAPSRHHDVAHTDIAATRATQWSAGIDDDAEASQYLGCFALKLADIESAVDALYRSGSGFLSGGFGIGLGVSTSSLPSLLAGSRAVPLCDDHVRALDDALAILVSAGARAEELAMPHPVELRPGADHNLSTFSAVTLLGIAATCGAKLVRASSGAGRLSSVLQPLRICVVDDLTYRALEFDLLVHPVDLSGAGFMGKAWDGSKVAYDIDLWRECLRVLKPGGHLLAFGGTRTYHRMAVAIEDAGFEIRDSIHWLYGSGFPKSLDVSKAIDKQRDDRADIYRVTAWVRAARDAAGITNRDIDAAFGANGMGRHWTDVPPHGKQPAVPTLEQVPLLLDVLGVAVDDVPDEIRRLLWDLNGRKGQPGENWWKREIVGRASGAIVPDPDKPPRYTVGGHQREYDITAPATDAARQWDGWGTALKPAHEPVVVARKPLVGTVAQNVLQHGTGALNIDGGRVEGAPPSVPQPAFNSPTGRTYGMKTGEGRNGDMSHATGRWPANLVLTHAADCADTCADGCPVAELDRQSGTLTSGANPTRRGPDNARNTFGGYAGQTDAAPARGIDTGGASRFFTVTEWDPITDVPFRYVAKPGKTERTCEGTVDCFHPTVKPVDLMRWLVRLVTPPGGTVLDPFLGSGTTAVAAILEGFDWIGCELTDDYLPIIEGRVAWAQHRVGYVAPTRVTSSEPDQLELFS